MRPTAPWFDENLFRFSSGPIVTGPEMQEGIIDTRKEFEEEWRYQYPDPHKWYHIATARYEHQRFLYIDHKLVLHYEPDPENTHIQHADHKLIQLLSWLSEEIRREILKISKEPLQYNRYLEKHLPYEKRTGDRNGP